MHVRNETLVLSKGYIRDVLPLEAKESKFANKATTTKVEHVPPVNTEFEELRKSKGIKVITEQ